MLVTSQKKRCATLLRGEGAEDKEGQSVLEGGGVGCRIVFRGKGQSGMEGVEESRGWGERLVS